MTPPAPVSTASLDCRKAIAAGLRFRLIAETVRATLDWEAGRAPGHPWRAGITRERERELLEKWKQ